MPSFRIRKFRSSKGDREASIVIITDLDGSPAPHYFPNLFATVNYELVGRSPHTVDKVLRAIGTAKMWAESIGRDLDHDLSEGCFLSMSDVTDVARFLGLSAAQQASEYLSSCRTAPSNVIFDARKFNQNASKSGGSKTATAVEMGNRLRWLASYGEWHRRRRFDNRTLSEIESHLNESAKASIAELRSKAPASSLRWHDDELLEAPDIPILKRIEDILHPDSRENPFSSTFVRWRNYLAWRLLFDTGARRGEVTSAATDSVLVPKRRFSITESKTVPRTVPIIDKTADAFDHFFMEYWLNLPDGCEAHRNGALFTDAKGQALTSGKFINRIFLAVRQIIGPQPWNITPHTMRRAWNHILSMKLDSLPEDKRFSAQKEAQMRIRLMGWSENSRQAARYNRRHIRERSDQIAQQMMDEI
ncbi:MULTISPECIES: site-specific integrase [unclassified Sphingobium]|uniref:site-specific integrase n=1 Tax=unclassified Sphingobium TaxID=2611147 RepID=UPI002225A11F|nr:MULTISPECIES: site-specific integrase [unclassified Sphingobium]MCW2393801.1 integrase [Sphingobium sp. B8D3B]MCW2417315.1 integrase [Sphingobium sp. B8D3C]